MNNNLKYEELKKIIESCHLNFLIGSGVSSPYLSILGNIEELLSTNESAKYPNRVIETSLKKFYFDKCIKGNLALLDDSLCETEKINDLDNACKSYSTFIKSLQTILLHRESNLVSKQANLFTTNMDLFLDKIIEDCGYVLNDGFSGRINAKFGTENFHNSIHKYSSHFEYRSELPLFNLFKMHGSVNWKRINDNATRKTFDITYDKNFEILKNISNIELDDSIITPILTGLKDEKGRDVAYRYHDLVNNVKLVEEEINHDDFLLKYSELVMINPTKDKFRDTTSNFYFYELLRMYANHLEKENSVLFVLGFSFADEHIKEITKRAIKSNPTLLIVVFCAKKEREWFGSIFKNANNVICLHPEDDDFYTLEKVNSTLFQELAHDLNFGEKRNKKIVSKPEPNDGNSNK